MSPPLLLALPWDHTPTPPTLVGTFGSKELWVPLPRVVEISPGLPAGVKARGLQSVVWATRRFKHRHRFCINRDVGDEEGAEAQDVWVPQRSTKATQHHSDG